jgi:Thrombospondin type 3 repeat
MFTKKRLASTLIAAGTLVALAMPLPSAAQGFDISFSFGQTRHDYSRADYTRRDAYHGRGYHYQPSRWDRDGDGIPNRYDRTPYGEVRMRDRDRDGVPNRFDNYPNNPYWR